MYTLENGGKSTCLNSLRLPLIRNIPIETFSFEQLGINEQLPSDEIKKQIDHLFKNWVCDRLNLSYSIVVEENE